MIGREEYNISHIVPLASIYQSTTFTWYNTATIFLASNILLLFHLPTWPGNKSAKYEKLRKYCYCIWNRVTTTTRTYFVGNKTKGWISKRVFQENKARQILRKTMISYPLIRTHTCAYQRVRNVRFSENLVCFETGAFVLRFALLPYYQRFKYFIV